MIAIVVLTLFAGAMGQRSPYLGRPAEYPGVLPRFGAGSSSSSSLDDRLGQQPAQNPYAQGTLHDQGTIDKVAQWPEEKQPYWFKNREQIAAHRGVRGSDTSGTGTSNVSGNRRSGSTDISEETGSGSGNVGGNRRSGPSGVNAESGSGSGNVNSGNRGFESRNDNEKKGSGSSSADSNRRTAGSSNADSNRRTSSSNADSNRRTGSSNADSNRRTGSSNADSNRGSGSSNADSKRRSGSTNTEWSK